MSTFLTGLKAYFTQFQWKNTTLDDFIRCMQTAFQPEEDSLTEFSNRWLKRQGVNSFRVKETEGQSALVLTQGFMDFADLVIKEQMVNVLALLSDDFQETFVFENILISGKSIETVIEIPAELQGRIKAYVLNYNELAYGMFYPDERSIEFFQRNLRHSTSPMLQLTIIQ